MGLKTRIWTTEAADEIRAAVAAARAEAAAHPTPAPPAAEHAKPSVQLASMQKTIVGRPVDPSPAHEGGAVARPKHELFATRVAPIEVLLAAVGDAPPAPKVEPPRRSLNLAQLRRGLMVALALAVAGVWTMRLRSGAGSARPAAPPIAAPSRSTTPLPEPSGERDDTAPPPSQTQPSAPSDITARQAVDALATGDFGAAERSYQALAQSLDGPSPYADAARILAARRLHPP